MTGGGMDINYCLKRMVELRASDLHLKAPTAPVYRIDGVLRRDGDDNITPGDVEKGFCLLRVAWVFEQVYTASHESTNTGFNNPPCCHVREYSSRHSIA